LPRRSTGCSPRARPTACRPSPQPVTRTGEAVWSGAVGSASYEEGRDATPDTQYRIGSITKTFTAVAIMQLRASGALDLDDRLEQHIERHRERLADDPPPALPSLRLAARGGGDVRDR